VLRELVFKVITWPIYRCSCAADIQLVIVCVNAEKISSEESRTEGEALRFLFPVLVIMHVLIFPELISYDDRLDHLIEYKNVSDRKGVPYPRMTLII
jgi:hypothetical protein